VGLESSCILFEIEIDGRGVGAMSYYIGISGGGGKKCHDGKQVYDCGEACNKFNGKFSYAALCTGHCKPGECLKQAAARASNVGMLLKEMFAVAAFICSNIQRKWSRRPSKASSTLICHAKNIVRDANAQMAPLTIVAAAPEVLDSTAAPRIVN
jgi:hypothetical protein